jgi:diguanylate cyclase (GGDEF)-like protein
MAKKLHGRVGDIRDVGSPYRRHKVKQSLINEFGVDEGLKAFQSKSYRRQLYAQKYGGQSQVNPQLYQNMTNTPRSPSLKGWGKAGAGLTDLKTGETQVFKPGELQSIKTALPSKQAQPASYTDPTTPIDWNAPDFDWTQLTEQQKTEVIKSPTFKMSEVKALGQQGLILSDTQFGLFQQPTRPDGRRGPAYGGSYQGANTINPEKPTGYGDGGELQWWQPMAYTALSNPDTQPIMQAAAITLVTGGQAAPIAVSILALGTMANKWKGSENPVLDTFGSLAEKGMYALNWGAQTVEQIAGTAEYLSEGSARENLRVSGAEYLSPALAEASGLIKTAADIVTGERINAFISDPKLRSAVWQASKSYYETLGSQESGLNRALTFIQEPGQREDTARVINAFLPLIKGEGEVWVIGENEPVAVQPGYTLDDAVQKILKDGYTPEQVLAEYQQVYGLSGVASDFMLQSVFDPLNPADSAVAKTRGAISEARAAGNLAQAGELTNLGVLDQAQTTKVQELQARAQIEKIKADVYKNTPSINPATEGIPWSETARRLRASFQELPADIAAQLSPWERHVAGLTPDGKKIAELLPNEPARVPQFVQQMFTLLPDAKARLFLERGAQTLNTLFTNYDFSPRQIVQAIKASADLDMQTMRTMGTEFLSSPEAYTTIGAARDFIPTIDQALSNYDGSREAAARVQDVVKQLDTTEALRKGFTEADFKRLVETLKDITDSPLRNAIDKGQITFESLKRDFDLFVLKPSPQPSPKGRGSDVVIKNALTEEEFKVQVANAYADHVATWGKDYWKIEQANEFEATIRALKGVQSLLLLDVSPTSIVNDFLNERVMLLSQGTFGLTDGATLDRFFDDMGLVVKQSESAGRLGDIARADIDPITKLTRGTGPITKLGDAINHFRSYLPRSQASSRFNAAHQAQITYHEMKKYMARNWAEGRAFDRMPASLEAKLREYGKDPQLIYQTLRSIFKPEQIESLTSRTIEADVHTYMDDAAATLGKDPHEFRTMMESLGVIDQLKDKLNQAKTPAQRAAAFDQIHEQAMKNAVERDAQQLRNQVENYKNKISTEKQAGVQQLFQNISGEFFETKLRVDRLWDDAFEAADHALTSQERNAIMTRAMQEADFHWQHRQAREAAMYKAAIEGMDLNSDFARGYLKLVADEHNMLRRFFDDRKQAVERIKLIDDNRARSQAWDDHRAVYNERFATEHKQIVDLQKQRAELFVREMERAYGPVAGATAKLWTNSVLDQVETMHTMIVEFRKSIQDVAAMPAQFTSVKQWRDAAWREFKPKYQAEYARLTMLDMRGAADLWRGPEGGSARPAPPEPTPPSVPPQAPLGEGRSPLGESDITPPATPSPLLAPSGRGGSQADQINAMIQQAEQRRTRESVEQAARVSSVWDVAEQFNREGPEPYNRNEPQQVYALLGALRKSEYGGIPDLTGLFDPRLTPEMVQGILERRNAAKFAEGFDFAAIPLPFDGVVWQTNFADSIRRGDLTRMYDLIGEVPASLTSTPEFQTWLRAADEIALQIDQARQLSVIGDELAQAETLIQATEQRGEAQLVERRKTIILDPNRNRRIPMHEQMREAWETMDPEQRQWVLQRAMVDPLSGLETPIAKALEGEKPAGWVEAYSDMNALKYINDTFGHSAGNEMFKQLGAIITDEVTKAGGRAFRDGGDEMSYWFPSEDAAQRAMQAIDSRFSQVVIPLKGEPHKGFSVSYGIGPNKEIADAAMYRDKVRRTELGQRADRGAAAPSIVRLGETPPLVPPQIPSPALGTFGEGSNTLPLLPPGGYDQMSGWMDMGKAFMDGWLEEVKPGLEAMKASALSPARKYSFEGIDADTQKQLNRYLVDVRGQLATTKSAGVRWANEMKDFTLLDYRRQTGFHKLFSAFVPYEFFGTTTMLNTIPRILDRPALLSHYARIMQLHETYDSQLPERLRNKIFIPMPFLPEWMGGGTFIDPRFQFFPITQFMQPLSALARQDQQLSNSAMYVLRDMAEGGEITMEQASQAYSSRSGDLWNKAISQAKLQQGENMQTGADYFAMLYGPALYLTIPYYLGTGKDFMGINSAWPSGQLPITRFGQAVETATEGTPIDWIGKAFGLMAKPEKWTREQRGLSEFGEWGDYYIDRQLANLVAEGQYTSDQATMAMIERKGPLYDQAVQRVRQELMLKVPGMAPLYAVTHGASFDKVIGSLLPSLFPGGILPPAEMEYKGLKQEYGLAWEAKKNGNDNAINEFFERHPEYESRLALRNDDPQERLDQFLRSQIWDRYYALLPTDRKTAVSQLEGFQDFLDAEPGESFSTEQLATWARQLNAQIPRVPQTEPVFTDPPDDINYFSPEISKVTDRYFEERRELHPNYFELQTRYYALPESERDEFLFLNPQYEEYRKWRNKWYRDFPDYIPVFNGEVFKDVDTSLWPGMLVSMVETSALTGDKLPEGASALLQQVWYQEGQPYGSFETWVENDVYPSVMNEMMMEVVE